MSLFAKVHMPQLDGATGWLNSEPLDPAGLRGSVVLVNFWTLTCINWLRQEPYVRAWSQAYRDDGLVVIGADTPEFSFEHNIDLVRQATEDRDIDYPYVSTTTRFWSAFDNHYWPALYFVDREGSSATSTSARALRGIRARDPGPPGRRERPVPVVGRRVEAEADWVTWGRLRRTSVTARDVSPPRTGRAQRSPRLRASERLRSNHGLSLGSGRSGVRTSCSTAGREHRLPVRCARRASRALTGGREPFLSACSRREPRAPRTASTRGGRERDAPAMVALPARARARRGARRTLEVTFDEPGVQAYAFTFG